MSEAPVCLVLADEAALELVLASGLVPRAAQAKPIFVGRDAEGALVIDPRGSLSEAAWRSLRAHGAIQRSSLEATTQRACWAAALPPSRAPIGELGVVLFELPDHAGLLPLASELLRLGCDRMQWAASADGVLLRAERPPYYSVERLGQGALRVFVPRAAGDESVWIALAHRHPLLDRVAAREGRVLLVGADGEWRAMPAPVWQDALALFDIVVDAEPVELAPLPSVPRVRVPLRLGHGLRAAAPTLWVIREDAIERLSRLVSDAPETLVDSLSFALVGPRDAPLAVLVARPGREVTLSIEAEAYAPLAALPELCAPIGATVEPPLRPAHLRALLLGDRGPDTRVWLAPLPERRFRVEHLAERALAPLADFAEHFAHAVAPQLEAWARAVTFTFDAFEVTDGEWSPAPRAEPARAEPSPKRRARTGAGGAVTTAAPASVSPQRVTVPGELVRASAGAAAPVASVSAPDALEQELASLEQELADDDGSPRTEAWLRMGALAAELGRSRDAGLAFARAAWDAPHREPVLRAWSARAMQAAGVEEIDALLSRVIARAAEGDARDAAAACALAAVDEACARRVRMRAPQLASLLEAHEGALDVRTGWLASLGLSRACDDALGLARARDRALSRVRAGLSVELDVPAFLRFAIQDGGAAASEAARRASLEIDALEDRITHAKRKRSALEAPEALTHAYVALEAAFAHARLGAVERAEALRDRAIGVLDARDPVHAHLGRAYAARIEQARQGRPTSTPLPASLVAEREALERFARYKIDRLRESSLVLEPHAKPDPIGEFARDQRDPRAELSALIAPDATPTAIEQVLDAWLASASSVEQRARALAGLVGLMPRLPESVVVPRLARMLDELGELPLGPRASLLDHAIAVAVHFDREPLAERAAQLLAEPIAALGPEGAAEVASAIGAGLAVLAACGPEQRARAIEVLASLAARASRDDVPSLLSRARLAGELAAMGDLEGAPPLLAAARTRLRDASLPMPERLALTRAIAAASGQLPEAHAAPAIQQLAEQLPRITDSYNTNSHFCLSLIELADALFLAHASEARSPSGRARRAMEREAEHVRRVVSRDMRAPR